GAFGQLHHMQGAGPWKTVMILGPFHRPRPRHGNVRALLDRVPVLDLEVLLDDVAVRPESECAGDLEPEPILTGEDKLAQWLLLVEFERLGREPELDGSFAPTLGHHANTGRAQKAVQDHRAVTVKVNVPHRDDPAAAADGGAIEGSLHVRCAVRDAGR